MRKQTKMWLIKTRTKIDLKVYAKHLHLPSWRVKRFYAGHEGVDLTVEAYEKIDDEFRAQINDEPLTWKERVLMTQMEVGSAYARAFLKDRSTVYNIANGLSIKSNEAGLRKLVAFSKGLLTDELIDEQLYN